MEARPADSATLILLRASTGAEPEVLLVARHENSRAFGGAHVFPGGLVDRDDAAQELHQTLAPRLSATGAATILGEDIAPEAALAFWVAAIRELFEEAGILLAAVDGSPLRLTDPGLRERFSTHRRALLDGTLSFNELVAHERLELLVDELRYFSRWITPSNAPRRYDARFFVAPAPADQVPLHDDRETTAAEWLSPRAALARAAAGSLVLTPPTARTLDELHELGTRDHILAAARNRKVTPILPKLVQIGDRMGMLYPGDVDYDRTETGGSVPADREGPLNRAVMEDGGWRRLRSDRP